ncbi:MAG TPA: MFS transporter [Nanoarchaeota archaeon]|nr:MFS transporter [Nanoarchaeota archaeon]
MLRLRHRLPRHTAQLFLLSSLFSMTFAIISPAFPLFIKSIVRQDMYVGLLVALSSIEWIIFTIAIGYFLNKIKRRGITEISLAGVAICYAVLPFVSSLWQLLLVDGFRALFAAGATVTLGLFIRDLASKRNLGKIEGFYWTLINIVWVAFPLAGGFLAKNYSIKANFLAAAIFALLAMLILMVIKPREHNNAFETHDHFLTSFRHYFANRNLAIIYLLAVGLATWFTAIYTYSPLFMAEHNANAATIGIALALFAAPLILLDFIAGFLADKFGYRRFLAAGFLIMAAVMFFAAFMQGLYIFIALMVFGCIGVALVEPLHEAYFFKITPKSNEAGFYPIFRTAIEVGYMFAPLLFSGIMFLSDGNFNALFLLAAIMMVFFGILATFLRKVPKKGVTEIIIESEEKEMP